MTHLTGTQTPKKFDAISPTIFELEQYMDYLRRCRRFRCTLLIHNERQLTRNVEAKTFRSFFCIPTRLDSSGPKREVLRGPLNSLPLATRSTARQRRQSWGVDNQARLTAHLLSFLHEQWPSACDFETLCTVAREKLPNADDNVLRLILADVLQGLFLRGIVDSPTWSIPDRSQPLVSARCSPRSHAPMLVFKT